MFFGHTPNAIFSANACFGAEVHFGAKAQFFFAERRFVLVLVPFVANAHFDADTPFGPMQNMCWHRKHALVQKHVLAQQLAIALSLAQQQHLQ